MEKLDQLLRFNEREVLQGAGTVSRQQAEQKAVAEYTHFQATQRLVKEQRGEQDMAKLLRLI